MMPMNFEGIEDARKPIFFCSFGKDSSSVLHGLTPWLQKTMVVFIDCGAIYPDITEWAKQVGGMLPKFSYLHAPGDIWEAVKQRGWPVDVEIAHLDSRWGPTMGQTKVALQHKLRPYTECMAERCWSPALAFAQLYGADAVISGERRKDRPAAEDWDVRDFGTGKAIRPIFEWSDADVWHYIDQHKIQLAASYQGRQADRRDCYICMGGHDLSVQRFVELKRDWPDLYHRVFIEHGFADVVPVMVETLTHVRDIWAEVLETVIKE